MVLIFFRRGCLGDMMDMRVVMELVIGEVVLVGVVVLVQVFYSVAMGAGVGGVGNRGRSVESRGGDASLAHGRANGGRARWRDCCKFFDGISGEPRKDLPYRLPFTLNAIDFFS